MKVRIIKRLNEAKKYVHVPSKVPLRQLPSTQEMGAPLEIQHARISIATKIDSILQRPVTNVGQGQLVYNKETGKMEVSKITDPKKTPMLYYVYKGITPDGEISNENNVRAVNAEIEERIEVFISELSELEKDVLAADLDAIIFYMSQQREFDEKETHQSKYMLGQAPGDFDSFNFATRGRSVYKDTRAGKDFMLKSTPELKNIPEEHHFLFSMENLMGRLKSKLPEAQGEEIPVLTPKDYDSNYTLGATTMSISKEDELSKGQNVDSQSFINKFYSNPDNYQDMSVEDQVEMLSPYLEKLIKVTEQKLQNNQEPSEFIEFLETSANVPEEVLNPFEKRINDILETMEERGFA